MEYPRYLQIYRLTALGLSQITRASVLVLVLISCVTLSNLLKLLDAWFAHLWHIYIVINTLQVLVKTLLSSLSECLVQY